jgi:hypothetical protein
MGMQISTGLNLIAGFEKFKRGGANYFAVKA